MPRLAALLSIVGATLALAACGSEGDVDHGLTWLSDAAASSEAETGRFELAFVVRGPDGRLQGGFTGQGVFDGASNFARFSLDYSSLFGLLAAALPDAGFGRVDRSAMRFDVVQDGFVVFVRSPSLANKLPTDKSWVRTDVREWAPGIDLERYAEFGWYDRRGVLRLAGAASGEVEVVGDETIRGALTTHVRSTVERSDYEDLVPEPERGPTAEYLWALAEAVGLSEVPLDVWADQRGRVRRLVVAFSAPDGTAVRVKYELYDYGTAVDYGVPRASVVANAADLG